MIDVFDIIAFIVFAVLIAAAFVVVVGLGMLPGWIARRRGHPQAAAINVASWLGIATAGLLWPLALIWAFMKPVGVPPPTPAEPTPSTDRHADLTALQARIDSLTATVQALQAKKGGGS